MGSKMEIIEKLSTDLNDSKVVLVVNEFEHKKEVMQYMAGIKKVKIYISDKRYCDYSNVDIITRNEEKEILKLFNLYEFSNNFIVLENCALYGSLWNYVNGGILTIEEAIQGLLFMLE